MSEEPPRSHNKARVRKEGRSIRSCAQTELEQELIRLKRMLKIEENLDVVWSPDSRSHLSGELREKKVYIYEPDLEKARETLRHEVCDFLISQPIEPFKEATNAFIRLLNEIAYAKKEEVVEKFVKLLEGCEQ